MPAPSGSRRVEDAVVDHRHALDDGTLRRRPVGGGDGMKLDEVSKMIVAKGIAALTNEHGVEKGKPKTIAVS